MTLVWHDLKGAAKTLVIWAIALVFVMSLYASFYPSMGQTEGLEQMLSVMPKGVAAGLGFDAITSGAGWVHSTFFCLLGLFVLCGAGVTWGAGAIAGEEEAGILELHLAHGISRSNLYWQRVAAIACRFIVLGLVVAAALSALNGPASLELDFANLPAEVISYLLIGFLCAVAALAVGAATGRRAVGAGAGAAVIVLGFMADAIGKAVEDWQVLRDFSPVAWAYQEIPLLHGFNMPGVLILAGASGVVALLGWLAFNRRDIGG